MLILRWSDEALTDLIEIIDYVDARNPQAANKLSVEITRTAENLPTNPLIYRPGRLPGIREAVVRPNYIIVYQAGSV